MNLVERLRRWCIWQRDQGTNDDNGYPYHKHVPDCEICQAADRIEALEAALQLMNITADHLSAQNQNYKGQITALVKEKHRREE